MVTRVRTAWGALAIAILVAGCGAADESESVPEEVAEQLDESAPQEEPTCFCNCGWSGCHSCRESSWYEWFVFGADWACQCDQGTVYGGEEWGNCTFT